MNKLQVYMEKNVGKSIDECTNEELYVQLLQYVKTIIGEKPYNEGPRKLYYISAEFLMGKLLSNHLINLGLYEDVKQLLEAHGKDIGDIEEIELEPSLGNGGLGRLAACFLDSIATLGLPGDGVGLNYHYGLFKQVFRDRKQHEVKNEWITPEGWLVKSPISFEVPFKDFTLRSSLYDMTITGYNGKSNKLRLFDIDEVDEDLVEKDSITFDKKDIIHNLTLFLYPDDSDREGQLLRIYQQYFMVSNAAQLMLLELEERGYALRDFANHVVIQINDTHPSMVIPELIRLLTLKGLSFEEAVEIVEKSCAYTNHTILAEALEKWPMDYLEEVVPHLIPILKKLDERVKVKYEDPNLAIIDEEERVHMARLDIHYSFSVNGVAALHTQILKESELKDFYAIYPEKFNNKTNGITFRRWLLHCNPSLTNYIESLIGDAFKTDAYELEKLLQYEEDEAVSKKLLEIKQANKKNLKDYLYETQGITINENSIFDIQNKRLHEYKRQQMNALYAIYKYLDIKKGNKPTTPITMIFGAKAAPAYILAKDIIHLILCLQELIASDEEVSPYLQIVMVENYNVTAASKLIPACDVSEQISLASKEASGTGNMKFMLNGAVTLGTEDGANVEIHELVGDDNIYLFGKQSDEVIKLYENKGYVSKDYYLDPDIEPLVDFIISKQMISLGDPTCLCRLYKELVQKDWFMTLLDVKDYIKTKERAFKEYEDQVKWGQKMLVNIGKAGYFSSDRTIEEYNEQIWRLK